MSEAVKRLEDYDTEPSHRATVLSSERISAESDIEIRELAFEIESPELELRVGQCIGVIAPGSPAFGHDRHFRLYSVADLPERGVSGNPRIQICVRRCSYIDDYSGEEYKGIASNYLCDLKPGATLEVSGPYGLPFEVPEDLDANLILIGSGTGIAPFRGLIKHIYRDVPDFRGRVWLFYGAHSGLELIYMNEQRDDFAQYYDEETFEAFKALSPRPGWLEPIAWDAALKERSVEIWEMLGEAKTCVYVAGLEESMQTLDTVFAAIAGSEVKWERRKAELIAGDRWVELVY